MQNQREVHMSIEVHIAPGNQRFPVCLEYILSANS